MNADAIITYEEKKWKGEIFGTSASLALLDPSYTLLIPMKQVISGAFDTLSNCIETHFGTPRESNLFDKINESVMRNTICNIQILISDSKT